MTVEEGGTMVLKIAGMISGSLALSAAVATAGNLERKKAALLSAERWLALVDEEKYGECDFSSNRTHPFSNQLTQGAHPILSF
jgi:hypothetical protein